MSPIIPSRYGHPKYNIFPQKSRATSLGGFKATQRGTPGSDSRSRRRQRVEESKITVQTTEDEDGDNFYSKHLAAARFQRNHRLINVLFSDIVVDLEQPSDADKLQACKKRVKSLNEYQKKIDDEMVELNAKFNIKKQKIIDDGKRFANKLAEFVANSKKELEVLRAAQEVRRQQEAALRAQAKAAEATLPPPVVHVDSNKATPTKVTPKLTINNNELTTTNSASENKLNSNLNEVAETNPIITKSNKKVTVIDACSQGGDTILESNNEITQILNGILSSVADAI